MGEERNVMVNEAQHKVRLSSILKFYTRDFSKKAPNLIAHEHSGAK